MLQSLLIILLIILIPPLILLTKFWISKWRSTAYNQRTIFWCADKNIDRRIEILKIMIQNGCIVKVKKLYRRYLLIYQNGQTCDLLFLNGNLFWNYWVWGDTGVMDKRLKRRWGALAALCCQEFGMWADTIQGEAAPQQGPDVFEK